MLAVVEVQQSPKSVKEVQKLQRECKVSVIGCTPLLYNRSMTFGLRYGCILPCCQFASIFLWLHRLHSLWVRWVMHNSVQPTLYRYNYSELAGVFILGRNSLQEGGCNNLLLYLIGFSYMLPYCKLDFVHQWPCLLNLLYDGILCIYYPDIL